MSNGLREVYFECEICHKKMSCKSNLGRHIKEQHSTVKRTYSCLQCLAEFRRRCDLKAHYAKRHPDEMYETESINYQISRCETDFSRGASYLGDQQTSAELPEVLEVQRQVPQNSHSAIPVRTSSIDPFDHHAPVTGQDKVTTRLYRQGIAAQNSETDFLYQAPRSRVSLESGAIQRTFNPAVMGTGNAESQQRGRSTLSQRNNDYPSCRSLMKQVADTGDACGTSSRQVGGKHLESNAGQGHVPHGKRHCPNTLQSGASGDANVQIINVVGNVDLEGGHNHDGGNTHGSKRNNTDRGTQLQSIESRKKSGLSRDTSKYAELDNPTRSSKKKEQGKHNAPLRVEGAVDQDSSKGSSDLRNGSRCDASMSTQNKNRRFTVTEQDDTISMQRQTHGKKTKRSRDQVVADEHKQLTKKKTSTLSKSRRLVNKKRKLYIKCKRFAAAYEKKVQNASVEGCTLNKKPVAMRKSLLAQRANAPVFGSPAADLSRGNQHCNVSHDVQTTGTREAAMETADEGIADTNRETCGTQTDPTLDSDQRKWKDTSHCETNRRQSPVQRVTGHSSESASSSNTSLPLLLDQFGPRLTEYEERSTIEDFGADGALSRREVTERKYKMDPGEGRSIVKTEIG